MDDRRDKWAGLAVAGGLLAAFWFLPPVTAALVVAGAVTVYVVIHAARGDG